MYAPARRLWTQPCALPQHNGHFTIPYGLHQLYNSWFACIANHPCIPNLYRNLVCPHYLYELECRDLVGLLKDAIVLDLVRLLNIMCLVSLQLLSL